MAKKRGYGRATAAQLGQAAELTREQLRLEVRVKEDSAQIAILKFNIKRLMAGKGLKDG